MKKVRFRYYSLELGGGLDQHTSEIHEITDEEFGIVEFLLASREWDGRIRRDLQYYNHKFGVYYIRNHIDWATPYLKDYEPSMTIEEVLDYINNDEEFDVFIGVISSDAPECFFKYDFNSELNPNGPHNGMAVQEMVTVS